MVEEVRRVCLRLEGGRDPRYISGRQMSLEDVGKAKDRGGGEGERRFSTARDLTGETQGRAADGE